MRPSSIALGVGLIAAVGLALVYGSSSNNGASSTATAEPDPQQEQQDMAPAIDPNAQLPPNHPHIDNMPMPQQSAGSADESPALSWTAPKEWSQVPNPNPMRLATYKIKDDTELVVSRAGGDVQQNISRWSGQFEGSPAPKQTTKTVHGLKATLVQLEGTYSGGMGPQTGSHEGWMMLSAIVETAGEHYFFKMTGPAATVKAAQKPFEAMIDGVAPPKR